MLETERYPLPRGVADAVLNRAQLADALGLTEPTIDKMRKDGMPVLQEGSNGQAYQFQLSACFAWKRARETEKQETDARIADTIRQMRMELLGGDAGSSEMALSPKQRKELYEVDHAYNRLAEQRGELVPRAEVVALLNRIFEAVRATVNGMPDRLSRDAGLTGRQAEQAVAVADDLLTELHRLLSEQAFAHADFREAAE